MLNLRDLWAGIAFLAIGLVLIFILIPTGVAEPKKVPFAVLSPSYYPRLVAIAMAVLGAVIAVRGVRHASDGVRFAAPDGVAALKVCAVFVILFSTAYALPTAGFVLGGAVALAALMLLAGERRPLIVGLNAILLPLVLYLFFTKLANIPIPGGVLDPYLLRI